MRNLVRLVAGWLGVATALLSSPALAGASLPAPSRHLISVWRAEDGLPQNSVTCLAQTPDGYLWVGTRRGGLARFDGLRFVKFTPQTTPALKDVEIEHLTVDAAGALWITTGIESISLYRDGQFHIVREPRAPPRWHPTVPVATYSNEVLFAALGPELRRIRSDTLTNEPVVLTPVPPLGARARTFCQDREGGLWYLTQDRWLGRFLDGRFQELPAQPALDERRISSLAADRDGRVWAATSRRIATWQGGEFQDRTPAQGSTPEEVTQLVPAGSGSLWVCEPGRLRRLEQGRWVAEARGWQTREDGASTPPRFFGDTQGGLWVIDYGVGMRHVEPGGEVWRLTEQDGLPSRFISCFLEDREGTIWVGSVGGGLACIRERVFQVHGPGEGGSGKAVQSICEDAQGRVWLGMVSGDLLRQDAAGFLPIPLPQPAGRPIEGVTVFPGASNALWIGSMHGGVMEWRSDRVSHPFPPERLLNASARVLFQDSTGRLWIGSGSGLYAWQSGRLTLFGKRHGFAEQVGIGALAEHPPGQVWIGTGAGDLWQFKDSRFTRYSPPQDWPHTRVAALLPQADGVIWIGTLGGGLLRFQEGGFKRITTREGLTDDTITQLLSDDEGNLWAGSFAGILHLKRTELERFFGGRDDKLECRAFGRFDGLPALECSGGFQPACWRAHDGQLWFASVKGAVAVRPGEVTVNRLPPPVLVEELRVDGKARGFKSEAGGHADQPRTKPAVLEIEPGQHYVQFRFTGLSFIAPDRVRFQWKLEGMEPDWQEGGTHREVGFGPLPPGDYRFVVRACNNDGVWNLTGDSLAFRVLPHFWETWWFKGGIIGISFALLALALTLGLRRRHRLELERLERRHAVETERARIAQDLHDDLGTGLTQMSMLSALVGRETSVSGEVREMTRQIRVRSREMVSALNEIVWAVNPRNDSLNELFGYFGNFAEEFFRAGDIRCRLDFPDQFPDVPLASETRHNLFLAFKEALNNAAKHSCASEVRVRAQLGGSGVVLAIEDNGRGFSGGPAGNGLANMRQRLERVGGSCEIRSDPGQGTRVTFRFPAA
ncbi:MAG: triple tyrosine motif-containing protein [Verrucomicrobia bacterium]|nr:triple tyrosine motif-containing protein [Verrucomicrobiota bacterium]